MSSRTEERSARVLPGVTMLVVSIAVDLAGLALIVWTVVSAAREASVTGGTWIGLIAGLLITGLGALGTLGLFVVQPNQAAVLILFGRYIGTVRTDRWFWANPFTGGDRRNVSRGSPVEIAAVVVWRVVGTARAVFDVDDFEEFVAVQSETAVRHLATQYPYDSYEEHEVTSLSGDVH